jgi:hypothetical protein
MNPTGLRPEKGCAGEAQQQFQITEGSSRERGHPIMTIHQLPKYNFEEHERKIVHRYHMGA